MGKQPPATWVQVYADPTEPGPPGHPKRHGAARYIAEPIVMGPMRRAADGRLFTPVGTQVIDQRVLGAP